MLWHTEPIIHLEHTILPLSDHLRPFPPQIKPAVLRRFCLIMSMTASITNATC